MALQQVSDPKRAPFDVGTMFICSIETTATIAAIDYPRERILLRFRELLSLEPRYESGTFAEAGVRAVW